MAKRGYDNAYRRRKAEDNQKLIVETMMELVVENSGGEVTFEALAKRAKISERTIYRFFKDKKALHEAIGQRFAGFLAEGYSRIHELDVPEFGRHAFQTFERHEKLVFAYLFCNVGYDSRLKFRKKLNTSVITKIIEMCPDEMTPDRERKVAIITALISAAVWRDIKNDFGFSGDEIGGAVSWALKTLLRDLCQSK